MNTQNNLFVVPNGSFEYLEILTLPKQKSERALWENIIIYRQRFFRSLTILFVGLVVFSLLPGTAHAAVQTNSCIKEYIYSDMLKEWKLKTQIFLLPGDFSGTNLPIIFGFGSFDGVHIVLPLLIPRNTGPCNLLASFLGPIAKTVQSPTASFVGAMKALSCSGGLILANRLNLEADDSFNLKEKIVISSKNAYNWSIQNPKKVFLFAGGTLLLGAGCYFATKKIFEQSILISVLERRVDQLLLLQKICGVNQIAIQKCNTELDVKTYLILKLSAEVSKLGKQVKTKELM
jgi:hypothetical protein